MYVGGGPRARRGGSRRRGRRGRWTPPRRRVLAPVSITRFPLRRFSPGAALLRNPFVHR